MRKCYLLLTLLLLTTAAVFAQAEQNPADSAQPALQAKWLAADGISYDWAGCRPICDDHGFSIFGSYSAEVWGNTTGGLKQGTVYTGLMIFGAELDLEKAIGWKGASVNTTWLWLSGRDASEDLVGNFMTVSSISGFNTLRMFNLWFQQNLLDDKISFRIGQINADGEFIISDYGALFINGTFGWQSSVGTDLPNRWPGLSRGYAGHATGTEAGGVVHLSNRRFSGRCLSPKCESLRLQLALE